MMHKERYLKATEIVGAASGKFYLGVESKDTVFDLMIYLQTVMM
jgi:hypothetical protein